MGIKSDGQGGSTLPANLRENLLMPSMHAVEIADGHRPAPALRRH
jgi:hypothetical protein